MCRRWYKIYLCNLLIISSCIMLLKSRERWRREEEEQKECLSSCLVLAIKLNDKETSQNLAVQHSFSYHFCFVFQSHNLCTFNAVVATAAFFICHINNGTRISGGVSSKTQNEKFSTTLDIIEKANEIWYKTDTTFLQYKRLSAFCIKTRCIFGEAFRLMIDRVCWYIMCHKVSDPRLIRHHIAAFLLLLPFQEPNNPQFQCTTNSSWNFIQKMFVIRLESHIFLPSFHTAS